MRDSSLTRDLIQSREVCMFETKCIVRGVTGTFRVR